MYSVVKNILVTTSANFYCISLSASVYVCVLLLPTWRNKDIYYVVIFSCNFCRLVMPPALFGMHCPLYSTVLAHHGPRIESLDANDTEVPGWPECSLHAAAGGSGYNSTALMFTDSGSGVTNQRFSSFIFRAPGRLYWPISIYDRIFVTCNASVVFPNVTK